MAGIPPARDTDSEDVAWALQTAEALWKRNERADAIVWLRRAAQAAAEIEDDDRAIELARDAAELTEWSAQRRKMVEPPARSIPPSPAENDTVDELLDDEEEADVGDEYIEDITDDVIERGSADSVEEVTEDFLTRVRADSVEQVTLPEIAVDSPDPIAEEAPRSGGALASALRKLAMAKEQTALRMAAEKAAADRAATERAAAERAAAERAATAARLPAPVPPPRALSPAPRAYAATAAPTRSSVPPAAQGPLPLAGRNSVPPPAQGPLPLAGRSSVPPAEDSPLPPALRSSVPPAARSSVLPAARTSVLPGARSSVPPSAGSPDIPSAAEVHAGILDPWAEGDRSAPRLPHDHPSMPGSVREFDLDEIVTSAPAVVKPGPGLPSAPAKVSIASSTAAVRTPPPVDLEGVEALSDLPDDEREALARCAVVRDLGLGEDVSGFALVFVIEGNADVTAVQVHAPAMRLQAGTVLRGRGTLDKPVAVRVVVSSNRARLATWSEQDVASAFRSCPWVEDDLCAAGDRAQALVGATMGPLGSRLDPELRYQVTDRLTLRVLAAGDLVFRPGDFVAGLHVVGGGRLDLSGGTLRGALGPGDFLLPSLALRAGPAPGQVRAGEGGALLLAADRSLAQELLVTCPPLLEILSALT